MMMEFYLDGQLVDPATNWKDVSSTLRRDKDLNLFLLYQEYTLTFTDRGYDYLIGKVNGPGFCTEVEVEIRRQCDDAMKTIFRGILFIADCEVNEKTCTIDVKVNDRSFFSKINNNKNIKTAIDAKLTKNQQEITPVQIYDLDCYSVTTNSLIRTVKACRVEEAFRYMIEFMTDNDITFVSDTFGSLGEWNGLSICTGFRLRGGPSTNVLYRWIPFSFIQLFNEINKRIPLVLLVENPYENPVVRIESIEYLYGQQINFFADNIDEIVTSFDDSKLYAIVKFGSPTDDTFIYRFPETINFFGYREEEFHLLGNCNIDRTLDLSCDWIVSSNILERAISLLHQDFDKDLFLINSIYTDDFNGRTTNDNFLGQVPPAFSYNALLNNASIADRYVDDLSSSIAAYYIDSQDGQALGYLGTSNNVTGTFPYQTQLTTVLPLNQESYDYGNFFDPILYRYVAVESAVYNIDAQITLKYIGAGQNLNRGYYQLWMEHFDISNNKKNTYQMWDGILNNNVSPYNLWPGTPGSGVSYQLINLGDFSFTYNNSGEYRAKINGSASTANINMVAGDYLQLRVYYEPYSQTPFYTPPQAPGITYSSQNVDVLSGVNKTYIKCTKTSIVGATFLNVDQDQFKVKLHKFNYPMTQTTFESILANPIGRIGFAMDGQQYRYGWINELKYNHTSGVANFVLATSKESQNAS